MGAGGWRWVESGGLRLAVREEGRAGGPTVLLVHGYPDNSGLWDAVARLLGERLRVVRFDTRGHGRSEQPAGRAGYRLERLADDIRAVADATSPDLPVHLVGHDWGSIQGWSAVSDPRHAHRFASFTSISGPDLDQASRWLRGALRRPGRLPAALRQLRQSWYMAAFQLPVLPDLVCRIRPLRERFQATARDARNGLELYRANLGRAPGRPGPRPTDIPVLQLALRRDRYCTLPLLRCADAWATRLWRRELDAGHWAPRTHPAEVAGMISEFVDHIGGGPPSRALVRSAVAEGRPPLTGHLVLITGAGSGIGRASALAFAGAGAEVLCVDLDLDTARETARAVAGHAYRLDVADGSATSALAERVVTEHGVPDIVMANAGIGVSGSFLDTSEDDWRRVLEVNLWGVVHTLRSFLPALVGRGEGGHLVLTASMAGYFPTPALPAYSTTKAGVLMLGQCLAGELHGTGIGVSVICPGVVHTNITSTTRFAGADQEREQQLRRSATAAYRARGYGPDKVAAAVLRAVLADRVLVPVTPEARLALVAARVAPALTRALGRWIDSATKSAR